MSEQKAKDRPLCAAYLRVSTGEQARRGNSLEDQLRRIKAYCEFAGLELRNELIFRDEGVSGGIPLAERPAGRQLVEALESGQISDVVALKLDRFFRSAIDALATVKEWNEKGIRLHLVDFGGVSLQADKAMGQFFLTMLAAFAEFERAMIAERTMNGLGAKKARGEWLGEVPLGFRVGKDGRLEEDPEQMRKIQLMKRARRRGLSYREIARKYGVSVATAHRIVNTDLRTLKARYLGRKSG